MNILEVLKLAATVIAEVETSGTCNVSKCGCCYESATCCPVCEMPYAGHKKGCKLEEAKIELDFKIREIEGAGDRALEGLIPPLTKEDLGCNECRWHDAPTNTCTEPSDMTCKGNLFEKKE